MTVIINTRPPSRITVNADVTDTTVTVSDGPKGDPGPAGAPGSAGPAGVGVPVGGSTGQVLAKSSGVDYATEWVTVSGGGSAAWGAITGTLSAQTDLQSALNLKADTSSLSAVATSGSAADLSAGILPAARFNDTAHGARAGGTLHADATTSVSGFMSGADKTKLNGIATGATANATDAALRDRATHTGTQLAATISDFATAVAATPAVTANTAKVTNATHTGDVTGATALTIANDAVSNAKLANMATATIKGRTTAGTGDPEDLTVAQTKTLLAYTPADIGAATAAQANATHTGDATGATVLTIAANVVDNTKLADMAANTVKVRAAGTSGDPSDLALAASQLLGRGASGDIAPIALGTNLSMTGTTLNAAGGGGGSLTVQDEGSTLSTAVTTINFTGAGVTATGTTTVTVNVPGGGGATLITAAPASDQSNWNPSGFGSGVGTIKLQPTTNSFISGIAAGATDQELKLVNDSDFVVCLCREDGSSTATNRFVQNSVPSVWLLPQETVSLRYSATLSRWVPISMSKDIFLLGPRSQFILPATTTTVSFMGAGAQTGTATVSTITTPASPTSEFLEALRTQFTNSTANGTSSVRSNQLQFMRGATAGRQGFFHTAMVAFTAMGAASGAVRAGMTSSTAVSTTLNAALTQCLLIGADTSMTNLRIFYGDGTAGTPVDLGANFPAPSGTAFYEYCFYAPPASSFVRYMVRRLDTRFVAEGSLTSNIPTNTTALGQRIEVMVGATAAANTAQMAHLITVGL